MEVKICDLQILRYQTGTSSWGGVRYSPMVFTEQGVAMLSSILNSKGAILVNIKIIRVYTKMREMLLTVDCRLLIQFLTSLNVTFPYLYPPF